MSENPWQVKKEDICKPDFEATRRCLLNSYHSYVQNHAGYIIAIIIGFLALISNFESFLRNGSVIAFFGFLILSIVVAFFIMVLRIKYWTWLADGSLTLTLDDVVLFFNYFNSRPKESPYLTKAPNTAILQDAIYQYLRICNPKLLVTVEGYQALKYWIRRTRRGEMHSLIEEAKKEMGAEQWARANDRLEIAVRIAISLRDKSKKDEIKKLQKKCQMKML